MGIGNAIKKQEQAQAQAQPQQGGGADIIGLLKEVQGSLNETRKAAQSDRQAVQATLDKVAKTAEDLEKVQNTITSNTNNVSAVMQSAVSDFDKGLTGVKEQVKELKVSQNEIGQAVHLKQAVRDIEKQFQKSTRETIKTAAEDLDEEVAKVQERFRNPIQWVGKLDIKEFFTNTAWLYAAGLAAVITLIMTVLVVIIGTRKFWVWATTTAWFPIVAAVILVVPAVLSLVAVSKWLWDFIKKE